VREAAKWLQAAFDGGGLPFAKLHLARLTFYAGQEDEALAHLKEHLSWRRRVTIRSRSLVSTSSRALASCADAKGEGDTHVERCA